MRFENLSFPELLGKNLKDPHVVKFQGKYHLYGTIEDSKPSSLEIIHASSFHLGYGWRVHRNLRLPLEGPQVCAPGMIADQSMIDMFVQTSCFSNGGTIEHFSSIDGNKFQYRDRAISSQELDGIKGLYDAAPVLTRDSNGRLVRSLLFTGFEDFLGNRPLNGHLYRAEALSNSWSGPWKIYPNPILREEDVPDHVPTNSKDAEWCLEGADLTQDHLGLWLFFTRFRKGKEGQRQTGGIAFAPDWGFKFKLMGSVPQPSGSSGENGHGCFIEGKIFGQYRDLEGSWKYYLINLEY